MNRRRFLTFLGIAAPVAAVAALLPTATSAKESLESLIKNWKSHPYHHTATLPKDTMFRAITERRVFPMHTEVKRKFFQYDLGSKS